MRTDLRHAIRTLLKRPGFTTLVLVTVALGIGATATIFSVVNAYYLRPLPFPEPDRLVYVSDVQQSDHTPASFPEFEDYRTATNLFSSVSAQFSTPMNLTGRDRPMRLRTALVARDWFSVFGVHAIAGRTFTADEHRAGAQPVVILSSELWRSQFGGAPNVAGTMVTLDDTPYTVIGVVDAAQFDFGGRTKVDAWVPIERNPPYNGAGTHWVNVFARLKAGVSLEQARSGTAVLAKQIQKKYKSDHGIFVMSVRDSLFGETRESLVMLLIAAGLLMLIATANVANLLLARATARGREFAVRLAIGAGRRHLLRQTLAESIVAVSAGSLLGLTFALWATDGLRALWPNDLLRPRDFHLDWRVITFLIGIAALTAVLCGIGPAFKVSLGSLSERLKQGWGHFSGGRDRSRSTLVAAEIALACVLLCGATLLLTSFWRVLHVDAGFQPENVLTMRISLPPVRYKDDAKRVAFFDDLTARLRSLPGVVAVGASNTLPLDGGNVNGDFLIPGRTFAPNERPSAEKHGVTPGYFQTLGVRLLRGRMFTEQDGAKGHEVVIVNDSLAKKFWPNDNPIGKRIDMMIGAQGTQEIIGVVSDVKLDALDMPIRYEGYQPYRQLPFNSMSIAIRTSSDPLQLANAARNQVFAIDPEEPVASVTTMTQVVNESVAGRRLSAIIIATFAAFALLLASVGIYGVVSYWASQRTREIGIRSALGARRADIFGLVIGRGFMLALCGAGAGVVASFLLTRYMESLLYGVSSHNWVVMTAVPLLLIAMTLVACAIPARRASTVDPVVALRFE